MTRRSFNPAKSGHSRVFLIEGRARFDHKPAYQFNTKAGGLSQGFGDVEKIEIPSSVEFGKYDEVGVIRGQVDRVTMPLMSRYAADLKSQFLKLARKGCPIDVHVVFGACTDPTDYNTFTKKVVIESAYLTDYSTDEMGALGSDEDARIDETVEISGRDVYELVQVSFAQRGGDVITNEILDVTFCGTASCGDCAEESDGCQTIYAISKAAGGSPGTPADVVFSLDGGATFYAHDIDGMNVAHDPDAVACVGSYLVVVSADATAAYYALLEDITSTTDPVFASIATGLVGAPTDIWSVGRKAFVVGESGYIYATEDITSGFTVLDAGVASSENYLAVHALSEEFAVAVGANGAITRTENGTVWGAVNSPTAGNITAVWARSRTEWVIGTAAGTLYYTLDGGTTWTLETFPGSGSGAVESIYFGTDTVGVISHTTAAGAGRLLRTTNGGYDWVVLPEGSGILPVSDRINAAVVCPFNPDIIIGVGLDGDGSDGYIIVGTD